MGMDQQTAQKRPFPWPLVFIGAGVFLIVLVLGAGAVYNSPHATPTPTARVLPQVERISVERAYRAYENYEAVFLDVRDLMSYEAGHINGSIHIPLNQLGERLEDLAPESWIITYCT
jgi:3-mercaptopyruvate sulfurtransferase SseA